MLEAGWLGAMAQVACPEKSDSRCRGAILAITATAIKYGASWPYSVYKAWPWPAGALLGPGFQKQKAAALKMLYIEYITVNAEYVLGMSSAATPRT